MKRLDIIISHEHIREVNDALHKSKVGGMTFYESKVEVIQNMNQ